MLLRHLLCLVFQFRLLVHLSGYDCGIFCVLFIVFMIALPFIHPACASYNLVGCQHLLSFLKISLCCLVLAVIPLSFGKPFILLHYYFCPLLLVHFFLLSLVIFMHSLFDADAPTFSLAQRKVRRKKV